MNKMKKIFEEPQFKQATIFFPRPKQVKFWDWGVCEYIWGIAYGKEIVCACCGSIFEIEEVLQHCPLNVEPIITYNYWVNFTDYIRD